MWQCRYTEKLGMWSGAGDGTKPRLHDGLGNVPAARELVVVLHWLRQSELARGSGEARWAATGRVATDSGRQGKIPERSISENRSWTMDNKPH